MSGDLTARDVIARAISTACGEYEDVPVGFEYWGMTDDVLAALAAAGWRLERDDQWEWGVRNDDGTVTDGLSGKGATYVLAHDGGTLVRRRPAGEWEVAPDA